MIRISNEAPGPGNNLDRGGRHGSRPFVSLKDGREPWQWKLTDEDWRNRKQWKAYELAVDDMVARTSPRQAPWTLIEGDDKNHARLKVLRTLGDRLAKALNEK